MSSDIAQYYLKARVDGTAPQPVEQPGSLSEAYALALENAAAIGAVGAWKLGGTNAATRELFATDEAYFGPVFAAHVHEATANLVLGQAGFTHGELELCFRLSEGVNDPGALGNPVENLQDLIEELYLGVEFPWSPFDPPSDGLKVLVADCCASGALVVSRGNLAGDAAGAQAVRLTVDGENGVEELAIGSTSNILGGPMQALADFLVLAQAHGVQLQPGQLVATGGCTPCVELPRGKTLRADFGAFGSFEFSLQIPAS